MQTLEQTKKQKRCKSERHKRQGEIERHKNWCEANVAS